MAENVKKKVNKTKKSSSPKNNNSKSPKKKSSSSKKVTSKGTTKTKKKTGTNKNVSSKNKGKTTQTKTSSKTVKKKNTAKKSVPKKENINIETTIEEIKKEKNPLRMIIIILSALGIISTSSLAYFNQSKVEVNLKKENVLEINEKYALSSFVESVVNCEQINKNKKVSFDSLGENKITLSFKDKNKNNITKEAKVKVVDTNPPEIKFKDKITVTEGDKVDLLKGVIVTDNSKEKIEAKIDGKYNIKKAGTYKLKYVAKDSSGNSKEVDFTLVVEPKKVEIKPPKNEDKSWTTSKGYSAVTKNGITYINGVLVVNKTYSLPDSYNPGLNSTVKNKVDELFAAAKEAGFDSMSIGSGFRSYKTQKSLYNSYVKRDGQTKADTYSARPGHSEHQTGLAVDICHKGYSCITSAFDGTPPAIWLNDNAYKYGFIIRYPQGKSNETGYKYESWHLRYVGEDLATKLYNDGNWITLESYFGITSQYK